MYIQSLQYKLWSMARMKKQNDIEQFLMNYQDSDENKSSLSENKATKVALNFKKFYDKYFSIPIENELLNYQYYRDRKSVV